MSRVVRASAPAQLEGDVCPGDAGSSGPGLSLHRVRDLLEADQDEAAHHDGAAHAHVDWGRNAVEQFRLGDGVDASSHGVGDAEGKEGSAVLDRGLEVEVLLQAGGVALQTAGGGVTLYPVGGVEKKEKHRARVALDAHRTPAEEPQDRNDEQPLWGDVKSKHQSTIVDGC